ncbi:elongin-A, partial [Trifolium medium]|nr:elongin-A [Trifolium medium]
MAQAENKAADELKKKYKTADANNGPGYNVSNVKSNIMKKSKIEFLKCREVKNIAAMNKNSIHRTASSSSFARSGSMSRIGSSS